ncbi:MAG: hypothetical protein RR367_08935 [Clostridia bacterium]
MELPTSFFGWVGLILDKYGSLFVSGTVYTLIIALTGTAIGFALGLLVAILRTIPISQKDSALKRVPLKILSAVLLP